MQIHLDLIGGLAGDMFIAAVVDALPQYESLVQQSISALANVAPVSTAFLSHKDGVLTGRRFVVSRIVDPGAVGLRGPNHEHVTWQTVHEALNRSSLQPAVREHAIGIFSLLARAEGVVHGVDIHEVTFHEVGAWDSIADVVGAAALIAAVEADQWTASPAPLGSGRVNTAHGLLSIPAPATTHLLLGMPTLDDGVAGERVTPTGAAILRYLCGPERTPPRKSIAARTLLASGHGFGTRRLAGLSNHLRVLCFDPLVGSVVEHRRLHILEFDVDDQSGEDLAVGLDRLRQYPAILDVTQTSMMGKKNRMATLVRLLVRGNQLDSAIDGCFRETTTIGLRHYPAEGVALKRHTQVIQIDGQSLRVKVVERPGGRTAKAESDDVLDHQNQGSRAALRRQAEVLALARQPAEVDA